MNPSPEKVRAIVPAEWTGLRQSPAGGLDRLRPSIVYDAPDAKVDYLRLLRRHRTAMITILSGCLLAAVLYALLAPKTYRSQTVIEITGINQDFLNTRGADPYAGSVTPDSYLETQLMLLKNETIADSVVAAVAPKVSPALASDETTREGLIRNMVLSSQAKQEGGSNLVRISLTGPDPQLVAATTNELVNQYIMQGQNARLSAASDTGTFLKQQLLDAKNALQSAGDALQKYAGASGIVLTTDTQEPVAAEHLREIQQGLAQAEVDRASRQSAVEMAQNAATDSLPQVVDDPTIHEDASKLTELRRQLADLSTTLTPSNYRVQKIQAQITDLETEIQQRRSLIVHRLSAEDGAAARRQQLLQQQYERQLAVATDQGSKQVRYNMLKHEVDVDQQIYQSMLQRAKEAGVMAALRAANARVVTPARAILLPYSPKLSVSLLVALLLGIVFSVLYIIIAERRDNSVRNPGESEQYVERPELAVIPRARLIKKSKAASRLAMNGGPGRAVHPMLEHWKEADRTFLTETYRSAGASILFSKNGGIAPKILLVTSPHPQCGKSVTVANLAVSLAEGGRRVLLIDGDLRRPSLPRFFGVPNTTGLTNALDEDERADPYSLIRPTDFPGVSILTSGAIKTTVARLLHSSRLPWVIGTMRNEFDFVLIDAPPLLGLADAEFSADTQMA